MPFTWTTQYRFFGTTLVNSLSDNFGIEGSNDTMLMKLKYVFYEAIYTHISTEFIELIVVLVGIFIKVN